jgi:hypothetical protein
MSSPRTTATLTTSIYSPITAAANAILILSITILLVVLIISKVQAGLIDSESIYTGYVLLGWPNRYYFLRYVDLVKFVQSIVHSVMKEYNAMHTGSNGQICNIFLLTGCVIRYK